LVFIFMYVLSIIVQCDFDVCKVNAVLSWNLLISAPSWESLSQPISISSVLRIFRCCRGRFPPGEFIIAKAYIPV